MGIFVNICLTGNCKMKATYKLLVWIVRHAKTDIFSVVNGIGEDVGYFKMS